MKMIKTRIMYVTIGGNGMERMTCSINGYPHGKCGKNLETAIKQDRYNRGEFECTAIVERLYEYENTGLTPEQIVKLQEQNAILKELLRLTAKDAKGLFNACDSEYYKHDDISEPENCKFCKSYSDGGCKMNHECKWRYANKIEEVLKDG